MLSTFMPQTLRTCRSRTRGNEDVDLKLNTLNCHLEPAPDWRLPNHNASPVNVRAETAGNLTKSQAVLSCRIPAEC